MPSPKQLRDLYRFPGFVPCARIQVCADDPQAVCLTLRRRRKKRPAGYADKGSHASMIKDRAKSVTWPVAIGASTCPSLCAGFSVGGAAA